MRCCTFLLCLLCLQSIGQIIANDVLSSGGDKLGEPIVLSWTLGETFASSFSSDDLSIFEGFVQPILRADRLLQNTNEQIKKIIVYPNPTDGHLTISSTQNSKIHHFELVSLSGINISDQLRFIKKTDREITVDLSSVPKGVYFLEINFVNLKIKHKIIKR